MRQKKTVPGQPPAEDMIRDIRRAISPSDAGKD
jgi:hypothetical protein